LEQELSKDGYAVVLARSGPEALELLQIHPVDCVLLDLIMPGMSGQAVCQRIKASPAWRFIPVLMLTGMETGDAMLEGFEAGADDFVSKSGNYAILRARLRAQLRRRHFEEEARRTLDELRQKDFDAAQARLIRESEERMQMALQVGRSFAFEWDLATNKVVRTASSGPILGFAHDAHPLNTASSYFERVHAQDRECLRQLVNGLKPGADTFQIEYRLLRGDGTEAVLQESSRGFFDAQGNLSRLVGVCADVTERKRAEAELRQQREWLRVTLTSIGDAVIATDTAGNITFLNPVAASLTGFQPEAALGKSISNVFKTVAGKAHQPADDVVQSVLRGKELSNLASHTALVSLSGREIPIEGSAAPIKDSGEEVIGVVLVFSDVTEMRRAEQALQDARDELARSNEQLEQRVQDRTARLQDLVSELEHFSYTITHDMRAPLRAMHGFASLMGELCAECSKDEPKHFIQLIQGSATRMDRLITGALQFTGAGKEEELPSAVDAGQLLRGILLSYPEFQPPKARISVDGEIPNVWATEAGLTQCFSNLLHNAVKFVPPGRTPEVRVWAERLSTGKPGEPASTDPKGPASIPGSTNADEARARVRIWFEDNGIGIPKEAQEKIFRMFQRATRQFEGTGVGLALVKKMTERMGGKVGVESEEGEGSRFWLEFDACS
jgi:PAS domain S-box-containing protein